LSDIGAIPVNGVKRPLSVDLRSDRLGSRLFSFFLESLFLAPLLDRQNAGGLPVSWDLARNRARDRKYGVLLGGSEPLGSCECSQPLPERRAKLYHLADLREAISHALTLALFSVGCACF
jgi:hypothetical protein